MKKSLLILGVCAGLLAASCSNVSSSGTGGGDKPLTENIPSIDKTILSGRQLGRSAVGTPSAQTGASTGATGDLGTEIPVNTEGTVGVDKEYTLLERLYSTTWYRAEEERDDGILEEIEEEFVYFDKRSWISKREYENGRPDDTDYAELVYQESFKTPLIGENENTDANACIVITKEIYDDDRDFEGYYLVNQDTLYIVDGDSKEEIKAKLARLIQLTNSKEEFQHYDDEYDDIERYVLSTEPRL